MGKLSDILDNSDGDRLRQAWNKTEAAEDFGPLPSGEYVARIIAGELFTSRTNGTPGYKLTFGVLEGDFADRQFWHDIWLTPAALPMAKRDLGKLSVANLDQLEKPLPPGIRCCVKLALRRNDNGNEFNKVRRFDVIGIDEPERNAFAPDNGDAEDSANEPEEMADEPKSDETRPQGEP
jgi:hypothetical protein